MPGARKGAIRVSRRLFRPLERLGYHLTPVHFYQPIPDTRELQDELWRRPSEMVGVDMQSAAQLALLKEIAAFSKEFCEAAARHPDFEVRNGMFETADAEMLFGIVRHFKPGRVVEIGSGHSTRISSMALEANRREGSPGSIVAIEPYPPPFLDAGLPELESVVVQNVEDVSLDLFTELGSGDVLFVDSSHVARIGGDVTFEFLEVIPRLAAGVIVHVHDIFLPNEYPKPWVMEEQRFWTEQYLLQAFLAFNSAWEVLLAGNFLHSEYPAEMEAAVASYSRAADYPGSFWMRRRPA